MRTVFDKIMEDMYERHIWGSVSHANYYSGDAYNLFITMNQSDPEQEPDNPQSYHIQIITQLSIKEVSYMVGYTDPNYFSKMFKKITGCTASEYKKLSGSQEVFKWGKDVR